MKKYLYPALLLSIAGAFLSGVLLHQHYFGNTAVSSFFCGHEMGNPCYELSLTRYSMLFGIPVAAYGLFFYILISAILLVADYAKGIYYNASVGILLPLAGLALIGDIALFIILIMIKIFCPLCISTYVINIALFITVFLWYRNIKKAGDLSLPGIWGSMFRHFRTESDARAVISFFFLAAVFLAFALGASSNLMKIKTANTRMSYEKIRQYVDEYRAAAYEDISLPESRLVIGNTDAPVKIVVFNDFLCSFCYKFFEAEQYLLEKFAGKIRFEYYSYPLDQSCNSYVSRTVYNNACIASAAMLASAELDVFDRYAAVHFQNYENIKHAYNAETAARVLSQQSLGAKREEFVKLMDSPAIKETIKRDIELAARINITSTPTIFIGGKRIVGARPKEVMEAIIREMVE